MVIMDIFSLAWLLLGLFWISLGVYYIYYRTNTEKFKRKTPIGPLPAGIIFFIFGIVSLINIQF